MGRHQMTHHQPLGISSERLRMELFPLRHEAVRIVMRDVVLFVLIFFVHLSPSSKYFLDCYCYCLLLLLYMHDVWCIVCDMWWMVWVRGCMWERRATHNEIKTWSRLYIPPWAGEDRGASLLRATPALLENVPPAPDDPALRRLWRRLSSGDWAYLCWLLI